MVEYAHKVYDENLFGAHTNNISSRVDSESMLITKSGVNFKDLTVEDIIEVKFNETDKCPSDTLKDALLHVKLYGARQDVGAIMITSPVFHSARSGRYGANRRTYRKNRKNQRHLWHFQGA